VNLLGELGTGLLSLGLVAALCAAGCSAWALRHPGSHRGRAASLSARGATLLFGIAVVVLCYALVADCFGLRYVAAHSSRALPIWFKIAALWSGQEGSLLLWAFLQALLASLVAGRAAAQGEAHDLSMLSILSTLCAFYAGVTLFQSSPFVTSAGMPADGAGLNPLLRHPAMVVHPPALYLGYVVLAVPYAGALTALRTGDVAAWAQRAHRWTLGAWLFLGLGTLLGARWAYDVLGWGGYWGWDPVENAGLLPWLAATGLLHAFALQERGRGFAGWNVLLAVLAYLLVIFGTWVTRSGVVESVHAYARSEVGGTYLAFLAVAAAAPLVLLPRRIGALRAARPRGEPDWRDGIDLVTIALLLTLVLSILIGSLLPTLSGMAGGRRVETGPAWFERVTGPQFVALLALLGVCPLLGMATRSRGRLLASAAGLLGLPLALALGGCRQPAGLLGAAAAGLALGSVTGDWAAESAARARRRGAPGVRGLLPTRTSAGRGGRLAHVGVVCIAIGVIGTRHSAVAGPLALARDIPQIWHGYTLAFQGLTTDRYTDHVSRRAVVRVTTSDGAATVLQPTLQIYLASGRTIAVPAVRSSLAEDLYVVLARAEEDGSQVMLHVMRNPLIAWLWIGGALLLAGGVFALISDSRRDREAAETARQPPFP